MNILFLCIANSARSQMAEGIARQVFGKRARIESAGSIPHKVSQLATRVLQEIGIDISHHYSKSTLELDHAFVKALDYAILLCQDDICPTVPARATRLYWALPDPTAIGSEDVQLARFRDIRDILMQEIRSLYESLFASEKP